VEITTAKLLSYLRELNAIGVALSVEKDPNRLLEMILRQACKMTNADGGTLYTREGDELQFQIVLTESLGFHLGGTSGKPVPFAPLPLHTESGEPNMKMVAACSVLEDKTINIPDAYESEEFDFSGTRAFDRQTGYRSQSFLTVPMKNHENTIIGVLQLINSRDLQTGEVNLFTDMEQQLVESLASQAAVGMTNQDLIEGQRALFQAFIELIASAIDEKSPYTAGHCRRVPELTNMIAEACCRAKTGPLKDFDMTEGEKYELNIAGWLHDCGKVTTPEYVVDKSTKLETIYDRIHLVDTRFEVLKRDAEIAALKKKLAARNNGGGEVGAIDAELASTLEVLDVEREFLRTANVGGEFMSDEHQQKVREIAARRWVNPDGEEAALLSDEEVYNLNIARGTLTPEERKVINDHIVVTIKMLESLPYPKDLLHVPELAGGHHERMDGKGYPRGLTREQMSVPARMMAIADIFEALTASDRPYKKAMPLSKALTILGRMKEDNHVDPDLFDVFVREKVWLDYGKRFLDAEQVDEFDLSTIPGYSG